MMAMMKKQAVLITLAILGISAVLLFVKGANTPLFKTYGFIPSDPPVIKHIEMFDLFPVDRVMTIKAENLAEEKEDNYVYLDDRLLTVANVREGENEIDVVLTTIMEDGFITITVGGQTSNAYEVDFPRPRIESLQFPNGLEPEADFLINGEGFHWSVKRNIVEIFTTRTEEYLTLEVKTATETQIKAELPEEVFEGQLTVDRGGWLSNSVDIELLIIPELGSLEFEGDYLEFDEVLTLKGNNFHEDLEKNIVVFTDDDFDEDTKIEVHPYFVSGNKDTMKLLTPSNAKPGDLYLEINKFESNRLPYTLKPGPTISFNERNASRGSGTGSVILSIFGENFSAVNEENVVYVNQVRATNEGMFGSSILRANLGFPPAVGTIYVETRGYKGNEIDYDFSWLLVPNIGSLEAEYGFIKNQPITIKGGRFSDDVILAVGGEDNELNLSTELISPNEIIAYISPEAVTGQVIEVQLRGGIYSGNSLSFTVGDRSKKIVPAEIKEEIPPGPTVFITPEEITHPFSDVSIRDWFVLPVQRLFDLGIIQGKTDGDFHPEDLVSRAEFLKMALASRSIDPSKVSASFTYVDTQDHWAGQYVAYALLATHIDPGDYFHPDAPITRAEAIKILLNVYGRSTDDVMNEYFMDTFTHWSVLYAAKAFEDGIVEGFLDDEGNRFFHPDQHMNRAEAAKIIFEMVE